MNRLLLTLLGVVCANTSFACTIVAFWEPWPPFQVQRSDGSYSGLDLDILKLIDRGMPDCTIEFVERPWKRNVLEIKNGKIDLTAGVFRSPERELFAKFSAPYRAETSFLFVNKAMKNKLNLNALADITTLDFRLGTTRGYYYGQEFDSIKPQLSRAKHRAVTSESQLFEMFSRGRLDDIISTYFNAKSGMSSLNVVNYYPVCKVYSADRHFMISNHIDEKKHQSFTDALNRVIASGEVEQIIQEYQ